MFKLLQTFLMLQQLLYSADSEDMKYYIHLMDVNIIE